MKRILSYSLFLVIFMAGFSLTARAQFRQNAFTQNYNEPNDTTAVRDTSDKLFTFSELFGGVAHKRDIRIGTLFGGSVFMPGLSQIYNRDWWKLPIVYGGIGVCAGFGGYYLHKYSVSKKQYEIAYATDPVTTLTIDKRAKTTGTWLMVGAGLIYWGSLMDGMVCYKKNIRPHPGRATVYSILLPGLGQAYNGEYWKIPIYWGGLLAAGSFLYTNNVNYVRYKRIHNEATLHPQEYAKKDISKHLNAEGAKYRRNTYRRYRDYSIVALVGVYLLQVIDANVFAYMHDFEVTDDISMSVSPTVIAPDNAYASAMTGGNRFDNTGVGLRLGFRF